MKLGLGSDSVSLLAERHGEVETGRREARALGQRGTKLLDGVFDIARVDERAAPIIMGLRRVRTAADRSLKFGEASVSILHLPQDATQVVVRFRVPPVGGDCGPESRGCARKVARVPELEAAIVLALSAVKYQVPAGELPRLLELLGGACPLPQASQRRRKPIRCFEGARVASQSLFEDGGSRRPSM